MNTIEIRDYDPLWPQTFHKHEEIIAEALGDAALRIEHMGSTAVPGLAAKPIVDILLVVDNSANEVSYLPQLEAAGYVLRIREPAFYEHRMFTTPEQGVHLHVYSVGASEIERVLRFRDRLRGNSDDRQLYEDTKRRLAMQSWKDMDAYADAKSEIVERILEAASGQRAKVN